jgi:hypothetical protein
MWHILIFTIGHVTGVVENFHMRRAVAVNLGTGIESRTSETYLKDS